MTVQRGRIEITERDAVHGLRTAVAYFPLRIDPELADQVRPIVEEAVAALTMLGPDARLALASEIVKRAQDAEAYEREARRRGVLAL